MNRPVLWWMVWVFGCLGLVGCVDLKPRVDATRVFVLATLADAKSGEAKGVLPGVSLAIRSVQLPSYLLQDSVAVRKSDNEIVYSDYDRWAEPLERGVMRVVSRNLQTLLGAKRVVEGAVSKGTVDFELELQVDELVVDSSGLATVQARCRVWPALDRPMGTITLQAQGPRPDEDMAGSIAVMSSLLGDLSRNVAEGLVSGGR